MNPLDEIERANRITPNTTQDDDAWILEELDRRLKWTRENTDRLATISQASGEYHRARNAYNHKWRNVCQRC